MKKNNTIFILNIVTLVCGVAGAIGSMIDRFCPTMAEENVRNIVRDEMERQKEEEEESN